MHEPEEILPAYRELTLADQDFLWEMLYQAIYHAPGSLPPRELVNTAELSRYVEGWGRTGDLGFAALITAGETRAVGAAWLRLFARAAPGYAYLDDVIPELSIALLPAYRGHGIGGQLMIRLIEAARASYPAISLSVSPGNPARHLYERCGFQTIEQRGDSLVMQLILKQVPNSTQ